MKTSAHLNPLTNPVISGDYIECDGRIYHANTDIRGYWTVHHDGKIMAQHIPSQIDLCAWFDSITQGNQPAVDGHNWR